MNEEPWEMTEDELDAETQNLVESMCRLFSGKPLVSVHAALAEMQTDSLVLMVEEHCRQKGILVDVNNPEVKMYVSEAITHQSLRILKMTRSTIDTLHSRRGEDALN